MTSPRGPKLKKKIVRLNWLKKVMKDEFDLSLKPSLGELVKKEIPKYSKESPRTESESCPTSLRLESSSPCKKIFCY